MAKSPLHSILDRSGFSPVTQENYANIIDRWIAFAGENPKNWTRVRAQEFYDWLLESGASVRTVNGYISSLRYVSKWYAIREGRPEADFAIVQQRADDHADKKRFALSQHEIEQLLISCMEPPTTPVDHRDFVMLVVGFETGMRRKSLVGLQFDRIKPHDRYGYPVVKVPIKGSGGNVEFDVPLSDTAMHAIGTWEAWLRQHKYRGQHMLARLHKRIGKRGATEWHPGTGAISMPMINKTFDQRASAAGLGHLHPHLVRHTFITSREHAGLSAVQIASITGHSLAGAAIDSSGVKLGEMASYLDLGVAGREARNSTPAWLVDLVHRLLP